MDLFSIIVILVVVGLVLWAVNTFIPMDGKIKKILNVVTVVLVILWLVKASGVVSYLKGVHF